MSLSDNPLSNREIATGIAFSAFVSGMIGKGIDYGWDTLLRPRAWEGPLFATAVVFILSLGIAAGWRRLLAPPRDGPTA